MEKIRIEVDKVILYYMDRVDPDGNLYRFYVYKDMASEIEYFCTEEAGDRWVKREEFRFRGDAACSAWRNATVDEIVEHFKNR